MAARATFFLSAGRCGTQTLHAAVKAMRPDAVVTHEPIGADYRDFGAARSHLADVVDTLLLGRDYIETGWTSYPVLPFYKAVLGAGMGVIHIRRNVDAQADSLRAHGFPGRSDDHGMLISDQDLKRHIRTISGIAALMQADTVDFEDLIAGRSMAVALVADFCGIADIGDFAALLGNKVDQWPAEA